MRANEDPKRTVARLRRTRAEIWLDILAKGCGEALKEARYSRYENENMPIVMEHIKTDLAAALDEYKAAEEAYEPYWRRVRMSRIKTSKPKTKKAA